MAKMIFKLVVSLVMVIALIPSVSKKESLTVLAKAPAALACEPQSCKSNCVAKGYATGFCGLRGACECLGHPVD
jgi:hypothetical protein